MKIQVVSPERTERKATLDCREPMVKMAQTGRTAVVTAIEMVNRVTMDTTAEMARLAEMELWEVTGKMQETLIFQFRKVQLKLTRSLLTAEMAAKAAKAAQVAQAALVVMEVKAATEQTVPVIKAEVEVAGAAATLVMPVMVVKAAMERTVERVEMAALLL